MFTGFSVYVRKFSNYSFLFVCAVIMDGLFSDEELFLTQNSFSEERVEDNFSIDSILDGLVACFTKFNARKLQLRLSLQRLLTREMKPCHFLVPLVVKRRH